MPDFVFQWVYAPGDFDTTGPLDPVPDEQGAQAQGSPPWQLQLDAGASPLQLTVTDDDPNFNEIGDPGQVLTNPITIDGVTYAAGSRVVINYVITTDDGFEGYSITLGSNNSGNNTTTAFVTSSPMVPGQEYEFTSEGNIGRRDDIPYSQFACFAAGTLVETPDGPRLIERIKPGELVLTRDHGPRPVLWAGQRMVAGVGQLAPIVFAAGVLGATHDLIVSPNHRMLIAGAAAQLYLGLDEVLVPAKALVNNHTVTQSPTSMITYVHLMFDEHQLIRTQGVWSESFYTCDQAMRGLDSAQRDEIATIFPEFLDTPPIKMARPEVRVFEGRVLASLACLG